MDGPTSGERSWRETFRRRPRGVWVTESPRRRWRRRETLLLPHARNEPETSASRYRDESGCVREGPQATFDGCYREPTLLLMCSSATPTSATPTPEQNLDVGERLERGVCWQSPRRRMIYRERDLIKCRSSESQSREM